MESFYTIKNEPLKANHTNLFNKESLGRMGEERRKVQEALEDIFREDENI